jgi:hypothetical protein
MNRYLIFSIIIFAVITAYGLFTGQFEPFFK